MQAESRSANLLADYAEAPPEMAERNFSESDEFKTCRSFFVYTTFNLLSHKLRVYIFERTLTAQVFLRQFAYKIELVASQLKHAILLRQTFLEY